MEKTFVEHIDLDDVLAVYPIRLVDSHGLITHFQ